METLYDNSETGCCPRFNPDPWQEKEIILTDRLFLVRNVRSIFGIPIGFGKMMTKSMEVIKNAGALAPVPFMLSDCSSLWKTINYIEISKEIPGEEMQRISGTFITKVYEGAYSNIGRWIKDMTAYVQARGKTMQKLYLFYTTCPKCAKAYGKNFTVLLGQV